MAEDGHVAHTGDRRNPTVRSNQSDRPSDITTVNLEHEDAPVMSPRINTPNPFSRKNTSLDLDDYFTGPRDLQKHSKWPDFLRMHGSILPKMVLPLFFVGGWATCITCISIFVTPLGTNAILLTVTGFAVSLGLSFRSSSAYERYSEGRRYWSQLILACQSLGRVFWIHAKEREGDLGQEDLLAKLTAMNLLVAFAVALKHKLRYEPYTSYDDLSSLVAHLDTFAANATRDEPDKANARRRHNVFKRTGEHLGVSFAESNPRKAVKKARRPLGNLPLEILAYLASFADELVENEQLTIPMQQTLAYNNIAIMNDVLANTERVLTTPLPIAYTIAISQITWVYVFLLPFQLVGVLEWVTIPAAVAAAYIILGILFIGREIENPFGEDVNDLPLESYCAQIATELDVIASRPKAHTRDWVQSMDNRVLWPLSSSGWHVWRQRGGERVREAVRAKTELGHEEKKEMAAAEVPSARVKGQARVEVNAV